ncbi:MAG TPA: prepilin-type N-terminal cleavage/methylation domain-containing protein [Abditibacteriaceae bacterium]|jgi:prepilin-type N-terminal cleavage/methylation domain-containing protein
MRKHTSARAGFTLIEVMIALAIFVVGALAIVRIFPPALAAIQKSQDRTNASRLASSQLERLSPRGNISSTPDAIYSSTDDIGTFDTTFAGAFNGTVNSNESLPRDVRGTAITALDKGRFIDGERQRVMRHGTNNFFLLTNFPYANSIRVSREDTVEGVRLRFDGTNYHFDFSDATLASTGASWRNSSGLTDGEKYPVGVGSDYTYYVSYRWTQGGRVNGVTDEPYVFPAPSATGTVPLRPIRDGVAGVAPIVGEVDVRMVQSIGTMGTLDDGLMGLCRLTGITGISAGDIVRVSYRVGFAPGDDTLGWRGLIVDQTPVITPTSPTGAVTLTTRGLDQETYGDTLYAVAYSAPDTNGVSAGTPVTGECVPGKDGICDGASGILAAVIDSGNQTNRVELKKAGGLDTLAAPRARIMYRPQDGWGVQAAVAARSYMPFFAPPAGTSFRNEGWREYYWATGAGSDIVYFQPSEAGKTVLVSYEYLEGSVYRTVRDAIITLSGETVDTPLAAFGSGNGPTKKVARAEIIDPNGNIPTITAILAVRGLSVQARTVWADNAGRYSQSVVTDYRKRS